VPAELGRSRREEILLAGAGNPFYLETLVRAEKSAMSALHPDGAIPVTVHAALAPSCPR
jgi:hypothetical protein